MVEIKGLVPEVWAELAQAIEARGQWLSPVSKPKGPAEKGVLPGSGHLAGLGPGADHRLGCSLVPQWGGNWLLLAPPVISQCLPLAEPSLRPEAGVPETCFLGQLLGAQTGGRWTVPRTPIVHQAGGLLAGPVALSASALSLFPWAPLGCLDGQNAARVTLVVVWGPRDNREAEGAFAQSPSWVSKVKRWTCLTCLFPTPW